ncbi:MAG: GAF domain-containing protein [Cyclobacteriaceae bacterium]|nr:GAF domain-containing protein [Cyclobacteriaceae bacterium]
MSLLNRVLDAGTLNKESYLQKKIRSSNSIALVIMFGVAIPFIGISLLFYPTLTFLPILAVIVLAIAIAINGFGMHILGRGIISMLPISLSIVYGAMLMDDLRTPFISFLIVSYSFSFAPAIAFDLRKEKIWLIIFTLYGVLTIFFFKEINQFFVTTIDDSLMRDGWLGYLALLTGIFAGFGSLLTLLSLNIRSEIKMDEVIQQANEQNDKLKGSENELNEKLKELAARQEKETENNWATQGIAEISTLLRSDQDSKKLYDKITSYITEYLEANQCGLFLVESDEYGENLILKLQSCYAYNRKKFIEKEISPGQGLIGQAYLEKSPIYLKDVPTGYSSITSGLGESTPSEVLIVPLIVNESVEGVIEFASFNVFKPHQIEFLKQLGETLASFININRINERTKILLEDTQQQAEEMRSQEEEMRQNMEELSATQEEMARKEQEYLNQIKNLQEEIDKMK